MKVEIENYHLHLTKIQSGDDKSPTLLFLHGFSNSSEEWLFLKNKLNPNLNIYALDFLGHGNSSSPREVSYYKTDSLNIQLNKIVSELNPKSLILVGYSMGGRAALSYWNQFPDKVNGLILESSTAGIEDEVAKKERKSADNQYCKRIVKNGIEWFANDWLNKPVFSTIKQNKSLYNSLIEKKKKNNVIGLINSLRGFGTGVMPSYWNTINRIDIPVLLMAGQLDEKFVEINKKMNTLIKSSVLEIIPNCGHNIHLEKPGIFINLVNKYLDNK